MSVAGIDLGCTKIAFALFAELGEIIFQDKKHIAGKQGDEVGKVLPGRPTFPGGKINL